MLAGQPACSRARPRGGDAALALAGVAAAAGSPPLGERLLDVGEHRPLRARGDRGSHPRRGRRCGGPRRAPSGSGTRRRPIGATKRPSQPSSPALPRRLRPASASAARLNRTASEALRRPAAPSRRGVEVQRGLALARAARLLVGLACPRRAALAEAAPTPPLPRGGASLLARLGLHQLGGEHRLRGAELVLAQGAGEHALRRVASLSSDADDRGLACAPTLSRYGCTIAVRAGGAEPRE